MSNPPTELLLYHYTDGSKWKPRMRSEIEVFDEYRRLSGRIWRGEKINDLEWRFMDALGWVLNFQPENDNNFTKAARG